MSRLSCVQNFSCVHRAFKSPHVQTFVRSKLPMSWLSCVPKENSCAQKLIICVSMSRLSCVQKCLCPDLLWVPNKNSCAPKLIICAFISRLSYVQRALCPDFRAFKKAYVQTFVRSKGKFVRSKIDNLCVHVQTIVRSKTPTSRPFVGSKGKFVRCKIDNLCIHIKTIVRSKNLMSRLWCVQKGLCPDLPCVPKENSCAQKLIICVFMSRLSCVQKCLCPDLLWVPKENLCAAKLIICAFISRLSYVERALCPDFRAFKKAYVQTFCF